MKMRIHTDKTNEVRAAIWRATGALPGVYAEVSEHGSRSRAGALELRLTGNSGRYRNTGRWGADWEKSATWDEWGVVLAAVFAADPHAICGTAKIGRASRRQGVEVGVVGGAVVEAGVDVDVRT